MKLHREDKLFLGFTGFAIIGLCILFMYIAYLGEGEWQEYAKDNDCIVVGHTVGTNVTAIVNGKVGVAYVPGNTTYKCNNGLTYTR